MTHVRQWGLRRIRMALVVGLVGVVFAAQHLANAQSDRVVRSQKSEASAVEKKLDQLIANQDTLLKKLDAIEKELQIVKVRCTR